MRDLKLNWAVKYLGLARYVSAWSKDPSTKVGAVVVNYDLKQEFIGYNGFPRGVGDLPERYEHRETKYKLVVHAEANAILKAGWMARGASLYVYPAFALPAVCNECAKLAIQSGIVEIISPAPDVNDPRYLRWRESMGYSDMMCREAGIHFWSLNGDF